MYSSNFDFREFQEEVSKKLQTIVESGYFQEDDQVDPLDGELTKEAQQTYEKIQKILNVPEMEKAHPFLFGLRHGCVNECDREKVDRIYQLGVDRGFISDGPDGEEGEVDAEIEFDPDAECGDALCGGPEDAIHPQDMENPLAQEPSTEVPTAFTVLYSAIKDGKVKIGEFYSNAADGSGAREDCIDNLSHVGYGNIRIIGTEQNNLAVNTDVELMSGNEEPEDLLEADDSEEFEKQETGDSGEEKEDGERGDQAEQDGDSEKSPSDGGESAPEEGDSGEMTPEKKSELKSKYTQAFRDVLVNMALRKSVDEMTLKEKDTFYGKLLKKWNGADPSEFMTDEEQEKLDKIVIKVNAEKQGN